MDTTLFLGGKEKTTLKEMSDLLGKETIDLMNTSQSFGNQQSHSQSMQRLGKETIDSFNTSKSGGSQKSSSTSYQKMGRELMSMDDVVLC